MASFQVQIASFIGHVARYAPSSTYNLNLKIISNLTKLIYRTNHKKTAGPPAEDRPTCYRGDFIPLCRRQQHNARSGKDNEAAKSKLFSTEGKALEIGNGQTLLDAVEILLYRHGLVPDVLLLNEANLLEELVETPLGNVLNHAIIQAGSLLGSSLLLEVADGLIVRIKLNIYKNFG